MAPIKLAARGGIACIVTGNFIKMKEVFLLKSKSDPPTLSTDIARPVAVRLGLRIQRLRADKCGKLVSNECTQLCLNSRITMGYAGTATPQQIGVSENDDRTAAVVVLCLLKYDNFPHAMKSELTFTAVVFSNRSLSSPLGFYTPFFRLQGEDADVTSPRTIGSRAFVNIETHTTKLADNAWEGNTCGFSPNSSAYAVLSPGERKGCGKPIRYFPGNLTLPSAACYGAARFRRARIVCEKRR